MLAPTYPLQVLLLMFSGIAIRHQADVIAPLVEEKGRTGAQPGLVDTRFENRPHLTMVETRRAD